VSADHPLLVVVVTAPAVDAELAADALWQAGASSVSEEAGAEGDVLLTADADVTAATATIAGRWLIDVVALDPSQPWLDTWREHARPVRAGRVVLVPAWRGGSLPSGAHERTRSEATHTRRGDVVVALDPGRAFGSGSHPSTRLALLALQDLDLDGTTMIDVGCGSGVLAISAVLLGAASVIAIDLDPIAVDVTRANAARNGVADEVAASTTPLDRIADRAHVVVANIGAAVLNEMAPSLAARTAPDGALVLSGLLDDQPVDVAGFEIAHRHAEAGWTALTLRA
jgi:ribosomal protein L11 methyltransferase